MTIEHLKQYAVELRSKGDEHIAPYLYVKDDFYYAAEIIEALANTISGAVIEVDGNRLIDRLINASIDDFPFEKRQEHATYNWRE
tara:strand:+ start:1911 stop:2165 length:255 start_codon:yes stop_codon:yes gene_type:complete